MVVVHAREVPYARPPGFKHSSLTTHAPSDRLGQAGSHTDPENGSLQASIRRHPVTTKGR